MVEYVESLTGSLPAASGSKQVLVHCWRGGMRSAGVAWLLDLYGFKVYTLAGGYKSYRHWIIETFSFPFSFNILGGYTGSGKTYVLDELEKKGASVINLEKLACHKGSAFGNIGMPDQPTQEMFENLLGHELRACIKKDEALNGNNVLHATSLLNHPIPFGWKMKVSGSARSIFRMTLWNTYVAITCSFYNYSF